MELYGYTTGESGNELYGYVHIDQNQNTGYYNLEVRDHCSGNWIMLNDAFYVASTSINWISPDNGQQGDSLNVTISGNNICYGDQWSGTLSQFRFSQWSGSNTFYGTATATSGNELSGYVNIPQNQDTGYYDLEVWNDCSGWIMLEDAFYVNQLECQQGEANVQIFTNDQCGYASSSFAFKIEDNQGNEILEGGYLAAEYWNDNSYYNYCLPITDTCTSYNIELIDGDGYGWYYCSPASALITSENGDTLLYVEGTGQFGGDQDYTFYTDIPGCTDPTANNYDPDAICDDGSCCYAENATLQIFTDDQCGYYAQYWGIEVFDQDDNLITSGGSHIGESWDDNTYYNYCLTLDDTCGNYTLRWRVTMNAMAVVMQQRLSRHQMEIHYYILNSLMMVVVRTLISVQRNRAVQIQQPTIMILMQYVMMEVVVMAVRLIYKYLLTSNVDMQVKWDG